MKTSDSGVALIKAHEGLRLDAYPDPGYGWAVPTIGHGHTSQAGPPVVTRGMKITAAGADAILRADLVKFEQAVAKAVKVPLTQPQFDALVSFTFNLGPGNLGKSTLLRKLNAGDYAGAAAEFPKWNRAGGKVLAGLTRRRADEQALFLSSAPEHPVMPEAPAVTAQPNLTAAAIIVAIIAALAIAILS